jgi:hypothetical protein
MISVRHIKGFLQIVVLDDDAQACPQIVQFRMFNPSELGYFLKDAIARVTFVRDNYHDSEEASRAYHQGEVMVVNRANTYPLIATLSFDCSTVRLTILDKTLSLVLQDADELVGQLFEV